MLVEERFERATSGLGLCERRQSGLNVFSHRLPGSVPGQQSLRHVYQNHLVSISFANFVHVSLKH